LLRAIATGDGYAKALYTAREIGAEVGEVLEAVEVREIENVQVLKK